MAAWWRSKILVAQQNSSSSPFLNDQLYFSVIWPFSYYKLVKINNKPLNKKKVNKVAVYNPASWLSVCPTAVSYDKMFSYHAFKSHFELFQQFLTNVYWLNMMLSHLRGSSTTNSHPLERYFPLFNQLRREHEKCTHAILFVCTYVLLVSLTDNQKKQQQIECVDSS